MAMSGPAEAGSPQVQIEEHPGHLLVRWPVPAEVPELRLLCVSDTHDQQQFMPQQLPAADILVHAGDFTCRGAREELESFRAWTDELLATGCVKDVVFVAGNHELSLELTAKRPAVRRNQEAMKLALVDHPHVHYLQDAGLELQGLSFYGSPWCTRFGRDWAFQLADTPEELGERFAQIPEGLDVLITHQPPLGQGDANECDARTGSVTLLERVLVARPGLHVFGHIHTGHGVSQRSGSTTLFVNAAVCDEDYKPEQKPILVQLVHTGAVP